MNYKYLIIILISFLGCTTLGRIQEVSLGKCKIEHHYGTIESGDCQKNNDGNLIWNEGKERTIKLDDGRIVHKYSSVLKGQINYDIDSQQPVNCISGDCWSGTGRGIFGVNVLNSTPSFEMMKQKEELIFIGKYREGIPEIGVISFKDKINEVKYKYDNGKLIPTKATAAQILKEEREANKREANELKMREAQAKQEAKDAENQQALQNDRQNAVCKDFASTMVSQLGVKSYSDCAYGCEKIFKYNDGYDNNEQVIRRRNCREHCQVCENFYR